MLLIGHILIVIFHMIKKNNKTTCGKMSLNRPQMSLL